MPEVKTFLFDNAEDLYHVDSTDEGELIYTSREQFESEYPVKPQLVDFVDGILKSQHIDIPKESEEYKGFCRQTLEMLYRLDKRKSSFKGEIISGQEQNKPLPISSPAIPPAPPSNKITLRKK